MMTPVERLENASLAYTFKPELYITLLIIRANSNEKTVGLPLDPYRIFQPGLSIAPLKESPRGRIL
jgi:hypothetical protein